VLRETEKSSLSDREKRRSSICTSWGEGMIPFGSSRHRNEGGCVSILEQRKSKGKGPSSPQVVSWSRQLLRVNEPKHISTAGAQKSPNAKIRVKSSRGGSRKTEPEDLGAFGDPRALQASTGRQEKRKKGKRCLKSAVGRALHEIRRD